MKFFIKSYKNKMNKFVIILLIFSFISCEKLSFQSKLFSYLQESPSKNICISPLSIYQILSLASNSATGETLSEIINTLIPDKQNNSIEKSQSLLNTNNINILNIYNSNNEKVKIANAILSKIRMTKDFIEIGKKYNALIDTLRDEKQVNSWCSEKTNGKINKIIDKIDPLTVMILLNAVYFKGFWSKKFQKSLTMKKPFYNLNNKSKEKKVDKMKNVEDFNYYEDKEVQIVELPYKKDSMSAIVILPNEKKNINAFISELNDEKLQRLLKKMSYQRVRLELPKFKLEYTSELNNVLKKLGMNKPFDKYSANFLGIGYELYIDQILQKTYLKVDEAGTEAAAVTVVTVREKGAMIVKRPKIYSMIVERPFLFLLKNNKLPINNEMLFMSKIEKL